VQKNPREVTGRVSQILVGRADAAGRQVVVGPQVHGQATPAGRRQIAAQGPGLQA